jgi:hypothetical protein
MLLAGSPLTGTLLERHGLRLEIAPLRIDGNSTFDQPVNFAGATFSPNTSTEGKYKFDTYRVSYRYPTVCYHVYRHFPFRGYGRQHF